MSFMKHRVAPLMVSLSMAALGGCVTINVYPGTPSGVSLGQGAPPPMALTSPPGRQREPQLGFVMPPPQTPQHPIDTTWGAIPVCGSRPSPGSPDQPEVEVCSPNAPSQCVRPCSPKTRTIQGEL